MWTARADADLNGLETALGEARDLGVAHLPEIAAIEAAPLGLDRAAMRFAICATICTFISARENTKA